MATVREIEGFMEERLPRTLSKPGDFDGTSLCTDGKREVKRIVAALDVTLESIEYAKSVSAQMMITHHPCIYGTTGSITDGDGLGRRIIAAAKADIALLAYHTRLDAADGGVNDSLLALLGLKAEGKFSDGLGRLARLPKPMDYAAFCAFVGEALGTDQVTGMDSGRPVETLAVVGGGGKSTFCDAYRTGADTYLTGEVAHNTILDARDLGMNLVCATHYRTECPVIPSIARIVHERFPEIEVLPYYDTKL